MPEIIPVFLQDFFEDFANPQKRIFVGYLLSAFVLALIWLCVAERDSAKAAIKKIFDKNVWLSTSSLADFKIVLINRVIMSSTTAALVSQITISTFLYKLLHGQTLIEPLALHFISAGNIAVIFTVFFFVFDDFSRFYVHRLMHRVPVLWAFHQVHHSAETMTPFTIFRTHPIEGLVFALRTSIVQGIVISIFLFLFGSKVDLVTVFGASVGVVMFHSLGSNLRHSHIKIRYPRVIELFFISPGQHQIHHSSEKRHFDKNYGVALAVWDLVFGSLLHSESRTHKFGLTAKFGEKHNLMHLYVEPFKAAIKIIKRKKSKEAPEGVFQNES